MRRESFLFISPTVFTQHSQKLQLRLLSNNPSKGDIFKNKEWDWKSLSILYYSSLTQWWKKIQNSMSLTTQQMPLARLGWAGWWLAKQWTRVPSVTPYLTLQEAVPRVTQAHLWTLSPLSGSPERLPLVPEPLRIRIQIKQWWKCIYV